MNNLLNYNKSIVTYIKMLLAENNYLLRINGKLTIS